MAGLLLIGTLVELAVIQHWDEPLQLTPFVLSVIGLAGVAWVWFRPGRTELLALRAVMALLVLGSFVGVFVHVRGNIEIFTETHANASAMAVIEAALGGRNPLVAPGMLALAGILAVATTYYHPALLRVTANAQAAEAQ
jgi:uncharacterized membrane protein